MDSVSLAISLVGMIGGIFIVYRLREQKGEIALGIGGPIILLGLVLLASDSGLISGPSVWVITGLALFVFASFFYVATRKNPAAG